MRASDRAYAALLEEIQSGAMAPGTVVGEVEQAARLGVSRTPLREAIRRLAVEGLVRQLSPRVLVVSGFDANDIRSLFEIRRALEESAARLAAARANKQVFAALAQDFEAARSAPGAFQADSYYATIGRFDAAMDAAVDNAYFVQALGTVRTNLSRARRLSRDNHERLIESASEHALIARAISEGDAELAAHATHVHLHHALTSILDSITEGQS